MNRPRLSRRILLSGLIFLALTSIGHGQISEASTQSAKDGFQKSNFPWYDSDSESVNLNPGYQTDTRAVTTNRNGVPKMAAPVQRNMNFSNNWSSRWWAILWFAVLIVLVAVVIAVVVWLLMRIDPPAGFNQQRYDSDDERAFGSDRVERLPFDIHNPQGDFLAAADAAYRAGDYSNAVTYLFSHVLLTLDRHQRVRLRRGKTNRQYLSEMQTNGAGSLTEYYERLMISFESSFFGSYELQARQFEESWSKLDDFQIRLKGLGEVTHEI